MFFFKFLFTLSWRRPLSYRNQSIDLLCKSMDWFLYDNSLRHERVKMGKKWIQHILCSSKILFCFWIDAYIFFQMVIFATLFRRCPTLWKWCRKWQRCFDVVLRCKFQRWHTQRCFNVDLTLCDVTTSYQPKNNVEPTLKCLLVVKGGIIG